jgi:hypothetical protein
MVSGAQPVAGRKPGGGNKAPRRPGRPSSYREEFAEQAYKLCLLGATDAEMADFFGVNELTINRWKTAHPGFCKSITRGKTEADANVAERLYRRALGYSHDEVHVSNYQGEVTLTPLVKHYPPDTQAASLWLRNRQPRKWRDKTDHEYTGKDGGPLQFQITDAPVKETRDEWLARQMGTSARPPAGSDPGKLVH